MLFLPMVKMHTLVSHTILLNIETLVSQQSEFAFFGAYNPGCAHLFIFYRKIKTF